MTSIGYVIKYMHGNIVHDVSVIILVTEMLLETARLVIINFVRIGKTEINRIKVNLYFLLT